MIRIGIIYTVPTISQFCKTCGITSIDQVAPSDHRALFININLIPLFQKNIDDPTDVSNPSLYTNKLKRLVRY